MFDHWTEFMLAMGMRYCIGRQSYAVGVCQDWVRDHWFELDANWRGRAIRDLEYEINSSESCNRKLGSDGDHASWVGLLDWMRSHLDDPIKKGKRRG